MSSYPLNFPLSQAMEVVAIARQGKVKEKAAVFAHNLWVLQGFAQKTFVGDPDAPASGLSETGGVLVPDISLFAVEDPVAALEKVIEQHQSDAVVAQASLPWGLILKWALNELVKVVTAD